MSNTFWKEEVAKESEAPNSSVCGRLKSVDTAAGCWSATHCYKSLFDMGGKGSKTLPTLFAQHLREDGFKVALVI